MYHIRVNNLGKNINAVISHDEKVFLNEWQRTQDGTFEPHTYEAFRKYIDKDTIYIDLGAYIGATSLFAAQYARYAFAFEPDPVAFDYLKANREANPEIKNLEIFPHAVGLEEGTVNIMSSAYGASGGSSILLNNPTSSWTVKMIDINKFIAEKVSNEKLFIKIDIEGYEYKLVKGMEAMIAKYKPFVMLSLHPQIIAKTIEGNSLPQKIARRIKMVKEHKSLFNVIGHFKRITGMDGTPVRLATLMRDIVTRGGLQQDDKELLLSF